MNEDNDSNSVELGQEELVSEKKYKNGSITFINNSGAIFEICTA